jgi:hypothetical protein
MSRSLALMTSSRHGRISRRSPRSGIRRMRWGTRRCFLCSTQSQESMAAQRRRAYRRSSSFGNRAAVVRRAWPARRSFLLRKRILRPYRTACRARWRKRRSRFRRHMLAVEQDRRYRLVLPVQLLNVRGCLLVLGDINLGKRDPSLIEPWLDAHHAPAPRADVDCDLGIHFRHCDLFR